MIKAILSCFETRMRTFITLISLITGLFGIISGLYSAASWADSRYAHAADVNRRLDGIQRDSLIIRRQQLDDKIFELKLQKPKTDAVQALIERYTNQMQALDEQITNMIDSQNASNKPNR